MFYLALGASVGVIAVRRLTAAATKWTPQGLAEQAGAVGQQVAAWWSDVQRYAAEREGELRDALGIAADDSAADFAGDGASNSAYDTVDS